MRALAVMLVCASATSGQAQQPFRDRPTVEAPEIRTSATVSRNLPVDLAVATFEFSGRGPTLVEAARNAALTGKAIRQALIAVGVPKDSLVSRGFVNSSWDERMQIETRPSPPDYRRSDTTYIFRDVVVARMHNMRRIGAALDTALAAGAQKLSSLEFGARRPDDAGAATLRAATQRARERAEVMAKAAGGNLGRLIELSTDPDRSDGSPVVPRGAIQSTGSGTTIVAPATAELKVSVQARWEFLPGT
jgi:uncharacterized protein YggE